MTITNLERSLPLLTLPHHNPSSKEVRAESKAGHMLITGLLLRLAQPTFFFFFKFSHEFLTQFPHPPHIPVPPLISVLIQIHSKTKQISQGYQLNKGVTT